MERGLGLNDGWVNHVYSCSDLMDHPAKFYKFRSKHLCMEIGIVAKIWVIGARHLSWGWVSIPENLCLVLFGNCAKADGFTSNGCTCEDREKLGDLALSMA